MLVVCAAGLCVFGAVMYRAGRHGAENKRFKTREKENELVDAIIRRYAGAGRDECLKRLRGDGGKK